MRQDECWRVIRRIVTPPSLPLIVLPIPTHGSEHVATEDERTETLHCASGEIVIEASVTALLSKHLPERPRWEEPLEDLLAVQTKRMI